MKLRTLPLGLAILASATLYAQQPERSTNLAPSAPPLASGPQDGTDPDTLPYQESKHLMLVGVNVAGQGPYSFLVDSAAERTVISRELVDKLALGRGRDVTVVSMTEAKTVSTALIPQLQFSTRSIKGIHAPSFPASDIGAAGVLGIDSLARQRIIFDFNARTMSITTTPATRSEGWSPDTIVVTGKTMYGRLVLTDATIDGIDILAIIDTGSPVTIGNEALRKRLAARNRLRPTAPLELVSVTGRRLSIDYTTVGRVRFGELLLNNMPIGFSDVHPFKHLRLDTRPAIFLGMDALGLFTRLSVDFARKEVRFELPETGGSTRGRVAMADPRNRPVLKPN